MRAMAGAGQALLLLCVLAAVLPLLVQGFIPVQFHRPEKGDVAIAHRSGFNGDSGDVHPLPHLHPRFKHRFVHRPSKALLETKEGEPQGFEIHPQWRHHFHRQHDKDDFTLAGEHPHHRRDRAHFQHHHDRADRMMREHGEEELHEHARHFKEHHRSHMDHVRRPGVWENVKASMGDGVSSFTDRLHSVGNGIKNWFTQSKSRVAPTISFSAEPTWLGRLVSEPARAESPALSGSCGLDAKLVAVVNGALSEEFSSEPKNSCAGMVEGRTKQLKASLIRDLKSLCSSNLDAPCELQFCDFFNRHARLTAYMVMSMFQVNPVAVALKHDTSSLCTEKDTRDLLHHTYYIKRRLDIHAGSISSEGTVTCQVCFDKSLKNFKHDIKDKLEQLCEKATCPKLRDSCTFVKEHKHLARTLFILKLRPWEMVSDSCASSCGTAAFPDVLSSSRVRMDRNMDEIPKLVRMANHDAFESAGSESSFPLHHQHHLGQHHLGYGHSHRNMDESSKPSPNWVRMAKHDAFEAAGTESSFPLHHQHHLGQHHLVFADMAKMVMLELSAKRMEEGGWRMDTVPEDTSKDTLTQDTVKEGLGESADKTQSADKIESVDKTDSVQPRPTEELKHSDI
eukprot:TRINITY_DN19_c0_g1_i1.p1 TRINITY_DN19_c0_g1~~TRINITY_DN19_c0_g1_i1.p1  ORF type:complete len:622 (+),score=93.46 TRINITY_DN19_c0_g1_i1:214-2079(+)